jgi:hypothetical protein
MGDVFVVGIRGEGVVLGRKVMRPKRWMVGEMPRAGTMVFGSSWWWESEKREEVTRGGSRRRVLLRAVVAACSVRQRTVDVGVGAAATFGCSLCAQAQGEREREGERGEGGRQGHNGERTPVVGSPIHSFAK